MNANNKPDATKNDVCNAITDTLEDEGVSHRESRLWQFDVKPVWDEQANGFYWQGEVLDQHGVKLADVSLPDWYLDACELTWCPFPRSPGRKPHRSTP